MRLGIAHKEDRVGYQVLHPDLVRYLLKGETDELTGQQEERIQKIKQKACPRCGASLHPMLNANKPFDDTQALPRLLMHCECGYLADYQSGLIIDRGSAANVQDPLPIIKGED